MSRKTRNGSIPGAFVPRRLDMLVSPAHQELSLSARRVLDRIEIEHMQHGGKENGKLIVTYDQFESLGIHRHSIAPAIRELSFLGFIEVTQKGRPNAGEYRWPNLFRLTYITNRTLPATDEWATIKTTDQASTIAKAARASNARGKPKRARKEKKAPVLVAVNGVSV
jgi:hypothetical protein